MKTPTPTPTTPTGLLVLVKHGQPILDPDVPPREWLLAPEGEEQSRRLASALDPFQPFFLASSPEPKAAGTAAIIGDQLGMPVHVIEGLEEFDRPALPILPADEHQRINARLFEDRSVPVLGRESADQALERFSAAVQDALAGASERENVVVVAHGTVIALLVAKLTGQDAFDVWKRLGCGEYVTLPRRLTSPRPSPSVPRRRSGSPDPERRPE